MLELPEVLEKLSQTDLPNLWKPRARSIFPAWRIFQCLGPGKLDLRKVKDMAAQMTNTVTVAETPQPV